MWHPAIAEQLVDQARNDGVDLVGPDGLLCQLTKQVLEAGLEVEMDEHLGYKKPAHEGRDGANSRNGTRSKTVITEVGPVEIDAPRDRDVSALAQAGVLGGIAALNSAGTALEELSRDLTVSTRLLKEPGP